MSNISNDIRNIAIKNPHSIDTVVIGLAEAFSTPKEEHHLSLWAYRFAPKSDEENIMYRTYLLFVAEALDMGDLPSEIRDAANNKRAINDVMYGLATAFATYQEDCHMSLWGWAFRDLSGERDTGQEHINFRTYLLLVAEALE